MNKYLLCVVLLATAAVQADTLDWAGSSAAFPAIGDSNWSNADSWRSQTTGLGGVPTLGDTLFIQRYAWGNEGVPGGAWDTGADGAILNTTITGLGNVWLAHQDAIGIIGGQTAELTLNNGANLSAAALLMANVANSTTTVNMSGNAMMTVGDLWNGISSTANINMSGTSALNVTGAFQDQGGTWGVTMDADSVLTIAGGSTGWANSTITALNAGSGDSILATDQGGGIMEYTVIPEPATLGLVTFISVGMLLVRKHFIV